MSQIAQTIANLDGWLDTMRTSDGYGGPVVHWWQNSLQFTGTSLDWRYEGIIQGYLTLWERTQDENWLNKAIRAGDDLVYGQIPSGTFRNSSFEQNPYEGGTPHEAAADIGLLKLALALKALGFERHEFYANAAERNLRSHYLERLWDEENGRFLDAMHYDSFVPNKVCTLVEALFALAEYHQTDEPIVRFAQPTMQFVLSLQATQPGSTAGGIAQSKMHGEIVQAYFPYYTSRCVPALMQMFLFSGDMKWLEAAHEAFDFVVRFMDEDGLLPQVVYPRGINRYPQWVAPLGDILRAAQQLVITKSSVDLAPMRQALFDGILPSGGIVTGRGFAAQVCQKPQKYGLPDFRDQVPVVGWCDKAFRYLATQLPFDEQLPTPDLADWESACQVRGKTAVWQETESMMQLRVDKRVLYQWNKGEAWTAVSTPEVLWK